MEKEVWLDKEMDILETLNNQEYTRVLAYVTENQERVMDMWFNNDRNSFEKTLLCGTSLLHFFSKHIKDNSRDGAIFSLGMLNGVMKVLDVILHEEIQNEIVSNKYKDIIQKIEYSTDIIMMLEKHEIMSHAEICNALSLESQKLAIIMKELLQTNLLIEKNKYYFLTDTGRRLAKIIKLNG